jgi:ribosomal protein S18 acetylase RimI-like enzyme
MNHVLDKETIVNYAIKLAKSETDTIGFIPRERYRRYANAGQLTLVFENDEPCGFAAWGVRANHISIHQACVQTDARRYKHGTDLITAIAVRAAEKNAHYLRLRCATDIAGFAFWTTLGFKPRHFTNGGTRRRRLIAELHYDLRKHHQLWLPMEITRGTG